MLIFEICVYLLIEFYRFIFNIIDIEEDLLCFAFDQGYQQKCIH